MKKLLLVFFVYTNLIFAQNPITLTQADMPTAGWSQIRKMDTLPLPTINFGNKGANQVYDFSNLVPTKNDTVRYQTNANTAQFPNADLQITTNGSDYLYTKTSASKLELQGLKGNLQGVNTFINFSPTNEVLRFTTQYGNAFSGSWGFQKTFDGSQVGQPSVDKVRITVTASFTDTIDGWGKVTTPYGSYKCLREKRKETTTTEVEFRLCSVCPYQDAPNYPVTNTNTVYSYLTKETKGTVLTFEYDSLNNLKDVRVSLIPPAAPVANFTSNITGFSAQFTDATDGYPDKYHWDFGDGDTSNIQNPTHTYAANGTYNVCLTVTGKGGSHTYCNNITINNVPVNGAPVAVNDTFNLQQGTSRTVNIINNDTDPDGDAICAGPVWGSAYAVSASCSTIVYTPNVGFSGLDTAYYRLCDNGNPVKCDTGRVVFIVVGTAGNNAPVAGNDTFNIEKGVMRIVQVGNNDIDPDGNTICVNTVWGSAFATKNPGSPCDAIKYQPNSTFTGKDTAYYQICDNGSPVKCDTGMVVFTVIEPVVNTAPTATNDTFNVLQATTRIVNVAANDVDPDANTLCVNTVWGSAYASKNAGGACDAVKYQPAPLFTGNDTAWYQLCDNGIPVKCDTGMVVFNVVADPGLLPVADFAILCNSSQVMLINESTQADSVKWRVTQTRIGINCNDLTFNLSGDTVVYQPVKDQCSNVDSVFICAIAINQFGADTSCGYACVFTWLGVDETILSNILLYPNPATNTVTIDMRNNQNDITLNYSAIEVFNTLGEKLKNVPQTGDKVITLNIGDLTAGLYVATIADANGTRRILGRFTVSK